MKQGNGFFVNLTAVDQVEQSVCATIQSSIESATLSKRHEVRRIGDVCSRFDYHVRFLTDMPEVHRLAIHIIPKVLKTAHAFMSTL